MAITRSSTTCWAILLLGAAAASAGACTTILGSFDFDGPPAGSGGGSSTTNPGGGGSMSSGTTCSASCSVPADCQDKLPDCQKHTCDMGCCGTAPEEDGVPLDPTAQHPGDCKVLVCDGSGGSREEDDSTDIQDDNNPCTLDDCKGGMPTHTPTAGTCTMGGKTCGTPGGPAEGKCVECNFDTECSTSTTCVANQCAAPGCSDNQKNGAETDVDCGGSECVMLGRLCAFGKSCLASSDCVTGFCHQTLQLCDIEILAANQMGPHQLAVDASMVYYVAYGDGTVMKVAKAGTGTPIPFATGQQQPKGIAIDSTGNAGYVYWTTGSMIRRISTSSGANVETLASSESGPGAGIAVNAGYVYWANDGDGSIRRWTSTAAPISTLTTGSASIDSQRLVTDGQWIYWSNQASGNIYKFDLVGTAGKITWVTGQSGTNTPVGIAVDTANFYWVDARQGIAQQGKAFKMPVTGGNATELASGLNNPYEIATDAANLYVLEYAAGGRVLSIPTGVGPMKTLASSTGVSVPRGIAVDGTHVYFGLSDNTIRRVLK